MNAEKLSISLPLTLSDFVENYRIDHAYKTKSKVIQEALKLLQKRDLEQAYAAANAEIDSLFDKTDNDGIADETW